MLECTANPCSEKPPAELHDAAFSLLQRSTPITAKLGVAMNAAMFPPENAALAWLQMEDWLRLIDVSPVAPSGVARIFVLTRPAIIWLAGQMALREPRQ